MELEGPSSSATHMSGAKLYRGDEIVIPLESFVINLEASRFVFNTVQS